MIYGAQSWDYVAHAQTVDYQAHLQCGLGSRLSTIIIGYLKCVGILYKIQPSVGEVAFLNGAWFEARMKEVLVITISNCGKTCTPILSLLALTMAAQNTRKTIKVRPVIQTI